jgi:hypothetical protein
VADKSLDEDPVPWLPGDIKVTGPTAASLRHPLCGVRAQCATHNEPSVRLTTWRLSCDTP